MALFFKQEFNCLLPCFIMLLNNSVLRIQFFFPIFFQCNFNLFLNEVSCKNLLEDMTLSSSFWGRGTKLHSSYETTNFFRSWKERIGEDRYSEWRGEENNFLPLSNCRFFVRVRVVQRLKTVRECRIAVLSPLKLELVRTTNRYAWRYC